MSELQLLSNGSYHVKVTVLGHGWSRWQGTAITRWCADAKLDAGGAPCHIRDNSAASDCSSAAHAMLSGAAPADHAQRVMASLDERLVHRDTRLVQLLDPPFDTSKPSPGYIQCYVPGVRENGAQYTHAAVWAAMAFAALGDADRAWEVFALLNPVSHARDASEVATYKVEPYVVAGDVYAFAPHAGRGGWMYQFVVESLLGVQRSGNRLCLRPLLPRQWTTFDMQYHFGASRHDISCRAEAGPAASVVHNGIEADSGSIRLVDDGQVHVIVVNLGDRSFINPSAHKPDGARGESLQDSQHDHSIAESS